MVDTTSDQELLDRNQLSEYFSRAYKGNRLLTQERRTRKGAKLFKRRAFGICGLRTPSESELLNILGELNIADDENHGRKIIQSLTTNGVLYSWISGDGESYANRLIFEKVSTPGKEGYTFALGIYY